MSRRSKGKTTYAEVSRFICRQLRALMTNKLLRMLDSLSPEEKQRWRESLESLAARERC